MNVRSAVRSIGTMVLLAADLALTLFASYFFGWDLLGLLRAFPHFWWLTVIDTAVVAAYLFGALSLAMATLEERRGVLDGRRLFKCALWGFGYNAVAAIVAVVVAVELFVWASILSLKGY